MFDVSMPFMLQQSSIMSSVDWNGYMVIYVKPLKHRCHKKFSDQQPAEPLQSSLIWPQKLPLH